MIKFGLIGSGFMADTWLRVGLNSQVASVVGVSGGRTAESFAKANSINLYQSVNDLCGSETLDAVIVTSPEQFHFEQAKSAILAKKHVLVEKPFTISVAEVKELLELARDSNVVIGVVSQNRNRFALRTAKALILEGQIGELHFINVAGDVEYWWGLGDDGSWKKKLDQLNLWASWASHACDLINFLSDDSAVSVFATANREDKPPLNRNVGAIFTMSKGIMSVVHLSHTEFVPKRRPTMEFEIIGSKGILKFDTHGSVELRNPGSSKRYGAELDQKQGQISYLDKSVVLNPIRLGAYQAQLDDFANAVMTKSIPEVDGIAGLKTQLMVCGALESIETGKLISTSFSDHALQQAV